MEYDFEEHRPVVTIHPFFTKVMKAHQVSSFVIAIVVLIGTPNNYFLKIPTRFKIIIII